MLMTVMFFLCCDIIVLAKRPTDLLVGGLLLVETDHTQG